MKVLVVDSGGRGHDIAWQFKNDPGVDEVICTPGNAGIAREVRCENARTNEEILELARRASKAYTKLLCREIGVPVAEFEVFDSPELAKDYIGNVKYRVVVKADGLAQGKGSIVCSDSKEAHTAVDQLMVERIFGEAGQKVVVEKRLFGVEISFFFFTDGKGLVPMPVAQDYKRAYDNDEGLNTGGMGCCIQEHRRDPV